MAGTRKLTIEIAGDARGATSAFSDADRAAGSFGSRLSSLGPIAVAGLAAVGTAAAGAAAGLYSIGSSFDSAYDQIRVATGATGAEMEGLQESFRNVARESASSFDDIATAMSTLAQRTGASGGDLEALTEQFLTLSRITETDVATNIENVTRLFGDWGIATEDQASRMDQLFRASQASGVGVDQLAASVVQFGAPLRNLGFGLEESVAMIAQFERNGVNAETVLAGMNGAVGRLARAGEDVPATFRRIMDEITTLGPGTEATGLAIELFGTRAGPNLADAIANGQFAVGDLMDTIANGTDTIEAAGADTEDFGEKWQRIKNQIMLQLEPLATRVFDAVGDAIEKLPPVIELVREKISMLIEKGRDLGNWLNEHRPILIGITTAIGVGLVAAFGAWAVSAAAAAAATIAAAAPIIAIGVAIAALVAGVIYAYENWGWFRDAVDKVASFMTGTLWPALKQVGAWITGTLIPTIGSVIAKFVEWGTKAFEIGQSIYQTVGNIVGWVSDMPGRISSAASGMWDGIKNAFRSAINWVLRAWNGLEFRIPGFDPPGPGPSFGGFTLGVPNVPLLAAGGIVSSPTLAMIGEAGPEAVVPLDGRHGLGTTIVLQNHGVIGSEVELERWLTGALANLSRKGRLTGLRPK